MNTRRLVALCLCLAAVRPAAAQEDAAPQRAPLPSRYADCLQPSTVEILLGSDVKSWGLGEENVTDAYNRIYGVQLCRAVQDGMEQPCRGLKFMKGERNRGAISKDCAADFQLLSAYGAAAREDHAAAARYCAKYCKSQLEKQEKGVDCAKFCAQTMPRVLGQPGQVCAEFVSRAYGGDTRSVDAREALADCMVAVDPTPAACAKLTDKAAARACRGHAATLAALRAKNPALCPKDERYLGACQAALDPQGAEKACSEAVLRFTKPYCDHQKATGGLQEDAFIKGPEDD